MEVEVNRRQVPKGDFRKFQECEAQTKISRGNGHIQKSDNKVGMVFEYHFGGRLGMHCGHRWLGGISVVS